MLVLAAAAALLASPPAGGRPASATVQATATIRVISAVRIRLDGEPNPGLPQPRTTVLRSSDGSIQRAKLIEFQ